MKKYIFNISLFILGIIIIIILGFSVFFSASIPFEIIARRTCESSFLIPYILWIPNWSNELYGELANYAEQRGLNRDLFNSITDAAVIEMIYDSFAMKTAGQKAKTLSKRKTQKPAAQNKPVSQRDARGRFANAKANFEQNPNQRGAFAQMKAAQLAAER